MVFYMYQPYQGTSSPAATNQNASQVLVMLFARLQYPLLKVHAMGILFDAENELSNIN